MFGLYITHPQVKIDPSVPVPQWSLSDLGHKRAQQTARLPWVTTLRRIISSSEVKAIELAEILADASGLEIEVVSGLHENDRSATGFLPPAEFDQAADWFFANPEQSFNGWERAVDAQKRIVSGVGQILDAHECELPVAFVGHGGVGTLLKCHMAGRPIARDRDQPAGGGNLFAFTLADRSPTCEWTPMEEWKGF